MNKHLVALLVTVSLLVAGCDLPTLDEIRAEVKATGTITDAQLKRLSELANRNTEVERKIKRLNLNGLTSITNAQAESLSKVIARELYLNGLTSITDAQAESLSKQNYGVLSLNGLTSITNAQAARLNKVTWLYLDGLTTITDEQAESLSKRRMGADNVDFLWLNGLTTITDEQAESLSKITGSLYISPDLQPLIGKYRNE